MLVLLMEGIYDISLEIHSCGMILLPRFMRTGTGVQAILRFCLRNSNGCKVGITDGTELRSAPLR
jgi:hypothetical protein